MTPNTYLFSTVYLEIFVETQPKEEKLPNDAKEFVMTPQTVGNKNSATEKTDFNIQGRIDTTNVCIQEPLAGYSKHKQYTGSGYTKTKNQKWKYAACLALIFYNENLV